MWGWGRHGAALIGWGWGLGEEEKSWGAGLFVTAGCWWCLSGLRLWFFACLGTFLLCAGAVVGGRRAPRVPLWALVSARLAPARRGQKVCRICVCRPMKKNTQAISIKKDRTAFPVCGLGGGGGRSAVGGAQRPLAPRPRPSGLLVVAGSLACRGLSFVGARGLLSVGGALLAFRCGRINPPAAPPCVGVERFVDAWVFASQGGGRQTVEELGVHGCDGVTAVVTSSQMMNAIVASAERR